MTSIDTWNPWIALFVVGSPLFLGAVSLAYGLYLSRRYMEAIKEALKNSRYIYIWGPSLGKRGLIWSLLEMSKITSMITIPKAHIRLGDLNPIDYENFPAYLKRRLKIHLGIMLVGAIWLAISCALIKFR